jgi:thiol-disulfide isomerase/thioredoxin
MLSGGPEGGESLARPAFVAVTRDLMLAVEIDGRTLAFRDGEPVAWREAGSPGAEVGGRGALRAATRTVFDVTFSPLAKGDPLLWIGGEDGFRPVGEVHMPEQAMLAPLANAGWVAPDGDEAVYFASALRPELRRYGADGSLQWTATWPREGVAEPRFGVSGSTLTPLFRLIQQALTVGPDGRVYVLVTRGSDGPADRLLVFDRDGTWVRDGDVDPWQGLYVGRRGHVYAADATEALAEGPSHGERTAFAPFALPSLGGGPDLRLEDYRGRVVVVNFWASWCVPCRREMPLLSRFAAGLDTTQAVVLGLNEDVDSRKGSAFVEELGGVAYLIAAGGGRLRDVYGYRGLPYTVVLDRRGRVAGTFYGFGDSIEPIEAAVLRALAEEGTTS